MICAGGSRQLETKEENLMAALDTVNQRYGSNTLFYAATGVKQNWQMMRQLKSPHYTTDWNELPCA
jgi:DNA polymerase V